jgi:hypothetical protein
MRRPTEIKGDFVTAADAAKIYGVSAKRFAELMELLDTFTPGGRKKSIRSKSTAAGPLDSATPKSRTRRPRRTKRSQNGHNRDQYPQKKSV